MRGKRSQGTSAVRPGRTLFAVTLTFSAVVACGSRSTLLEEGPGDYDTRTGGTGGSALGGGAGRSPMNGGRGAVTGMAGVPDNGGSFGRGGNVGVGAGPSRAGAYPTAGGAGEPGSGGVSGAYGSPAVRAACDSLCARSPTVCNDFPSDENGCRSSCYPAAYQAENCELQLAEYMTCVAARLNRDATCTLSNGECRGRGCTSTAIDDCSPYEKLFTGCQNSGCFTDASSSADGCAYDTFCGPHWHELDCSLIDATTGTWTCTCYVDGSQTFSQYVVGAGPASCQTLVTACNFSK